MTSPKIEEKIVCNLEVKEIFNINKVGTVAGCIVLDGTINRHTRIRVIRDGIVIHTGRLGSLKRFKEDVKEVKSWSGMWAEYRRIQRHQDRCILLRFRVKK
jgi:translation initiation factor IF-2